MYIVVLLIIGLAQAYLVNPKDEKSYHQIVLAIYGISFFVIWRFANFYFDVFPDSDIDKDISFVVLITLSFVISILPWAVKSNKVKAYFLITMFVVSTIVTFAGEREIKNLIADIGGYYNDVALFEKKPDKKGLMSFYYKDGGFKFKISNHWLKNDNKINRVYFTKESKKIKTAEIRPRCFHETDLTMPEIVKNIITSDNAQGLVTKKTCFIRNELFLTCMVRSSSNESINKKERWRWLVMNENNQQYMELDVVFYNNEMINRQEAEDAIRSFEVSILPKPLPYCLGDAEWF